MERYRFAQKNSRGETKGGIILSNHFNFSHPNFNMKSFVYNNIEEAIQILIIIITNMYRVFIMCQSFL